MHRLVEAADVFITNYPPAKALRLLGIAYDDLEAPERAADRRPSFTRLREAGPEASKPGFD